MQEDMAVLIKLKCTDRKNRNNETNTILVMLQNDDEKRFLIAKSTAWQLIPFTADPAKALHFVILV